MKSINQEISSRRIYVLFAMPADEVTLSDEFENNFPSLFYCHCSNKAVLVCFKRPRLFGEFRAGIPKGSHTDPTQRKPLAT